MGARLGTHDGIELGQRLGLFGNHAAHCRRAGPGFFGQVEYGTLQFVAGRFEFLAELRCGGAHGIGGVAKPAGSVRVSALDIGEEVGLGLAQGVAGPLPFARGEVANCRNLAGDGI